MGKILLLFCLFELAFALPKTYWKSQYIVELKKDEVLRVKLTPKDGKPQELRYRWTLHKDDGLVVILRYDGFVNQFVLYPFYQVDSYKQFLYPETKEYQKPFFLLKFLEFDRRKNVARLQNFVFEAGMKMEIEYLQDEELYTR